MAIETIWPIHPQPLERESMESWMVRQAYDNLLSLYEFITTCLGMSSYRSYSDFDFLIPSCKVFDIIAKCIIGGRQRASEMIFSSFKPVSGATQTQLHYWATKPSEGRRYCPLCFSDGETAYLRLIWRFSLAPVCVRHKIMLKSECGNVSCQAPLSPWKANRNYDLRKCHVCGSLLSDAPVESVDTSEAGYMAAYTLTKLLQGENLNIKWKYGVSELFRTLKFLIRFVRRLKLIGSEYTVDLCRSINKYQRGFGNKQVTYDLVASVWSLLEDWPKNIEPLIRKNQSVFNNLAWKSFPDSLKEYRSLCNKKIDWSAVYNVANELGDKQERVNLMKVAEITCCSYHTLKHKKELWQLVNQINFHNQKNLKIEAVKQGLTQLRADRKYPSFDAVKNITGQHVQHLPYLREMVLNAQLESLLNHKHKRKMSPELTKIFSSLPRESRDQYYEFWLTDEDGIVRKQVELVRKSISTILAEGNRPTFKGIQRKLGVSVPTLKSKKYLRNIINYEKERYKQSKG